MNATRRRIAKFGSSCRPSMATASATSPHGADRRAERKEFVADPAKLDDAALLIQHAALESSSLCNAVAQEVRRSREVLLALNEPAQLDLLTSLVEGAVKSHSDEFVAFQTLLLQRAAADLHKGRASIDRTALADRAALLRVRLAIETRQSPTNRSSTNIAGVYPLPDERTKSRSGVGVRWSLSDERSHTEGSVSSTQRKSSLCVHAFEALRGSVQAMEGHTPTTAGARSTSCANARSSNSTSAADASCLRSTCSLPDRNSSSNSSGAGSALASASRHCVSLGDTIDEDGGGRDGLTVTWSKTQTDDNTIEPAAQAERQQVTTGSSRGWEAVRSAILRAKPSGSSHGGTSKRRATIQRFMASEPGAEESDLRQLQMLRERSSCCVPGGRMSRRIAPEPKDKATVAKRNSLVVSLPSRQPKEGLDRTSEMSSMSCGASDSDDAEGDAVMTGAVPSEDKPSRGQLTAADGSSQEVQDGGACRASWESLSTSPLSGRRSHLNLNNHPDVQAAVPPVEVELREHASAEPASAQLQTHQPHMQRRGSIERAIGSRRASIEVFFRNRRGSLGDTAAGFRSRRDSTGMATTVGQAARLGATSRRASQSLSLRGSLSERYLSMHSAVGSGSTGSSLAAAAAFLLSDVTSEVSGVHAQRSRIRHASISSGLCPEGRQPAQTLKQMSAGHLSTPSVCDPTAAAARASFLGAIGGDPHASARLRASLTYGPLTHARRRSSVSMQGAEVAPHLNHGISSSNLAEDGGGSQLLHRCFERRRSSVQSQHAALSSATRRASISSNSGVPAGRRGSVSTCARRGSVASRRGSSASGVMPRDSILAITATGTGAYEPMAATAGSAALLQAAPAPLADYSVGMATNCCVPPASALASSFESNNYGPYSAPHAPGMRLYACRWLCASYDALPLVVLHPLSRLRLYWDALVALISLYSLFEVPLRVVFAPENSFRYTLASSINYAAVVIFVLHPFFETRTLVVRRGTPEDRPSAILWYYVHSWRFLLDVISACCPLLDAVWPPLALSCAVRLIFVLSFIHKLEKATKASPSIVRSIQIMLGALPAMHWFACIFCYLALSPGSWLESYQLERGDESINASDSRIYLHAVYWTLDTASTRGSGEMNASSDVEVIVICSIIGLSTLLYSAIIANMSTLLLSSDSTWNDHRRRVEVLKAFMRHRKLPTRLRQRIQNFLDYMWATQKGINEAQILQELPDTLQKQVTLFCAQHVIEKVPLFRGCAPDVSASIIACLEPRVYVPHDLIIERGAWGDEFFIVSEGVVVQLDRNENGPRAYLQAGSYFGELAALLGGPRRESFMALTHCFLYSLKHDALEEILHRHPQCIDSMLANMTSSYNLTEIKTRLGELEAASHREAAIFGTENELAQVQEH